jgi:hypothetical protein
MRDPRTQAKYGDRLSFSESAEQRAALIGGRHLICLVQSDDPDLRLAPVGATVPQWNRDEWLDRDRGL